MARRLAGNVGNGTLAVEDQRLAGAQPLVIQVPGADQPDLFAAAERDLDGAVGRAVLAERAQRFQNRADARLRVAAEDGAAVGADRVALDDRPDPFAGL